MAKKSEPLESDKVMGGENPSVTNQLADMVDIVATGKSVHMKAGVVYNVSRILAQNLVKKGAATLKQ